MDEQILPKSLISKLDKYLDEGEIIRDSVTETLIPHIDFRWIILTDRRVILAIRKLVDYYFKDFHFKNLDIDLNLGLMFDQMEFEITGKNYSAQFYSSKREKTLNFFDEIKDNLGSHKKTADKQQEQKLDKNLQILKELAKLEEEGIISQKEYRVKKKKILKRI